MVTFFLTSEVYNEDQARVPKPCLATDASATEHLTDPLREQVLACDDDTTTFYQSLEVDSPFFTVEFDKNYEIRKIEVINAYTGEDCAANPTDCTSRLHGAKVEVLTSSMLQLIIKNFQILYREPDPSFNQS